MRGIVPTGKLLKWTAALVFPAAVAAALFPGCTAVAVSIIVLFLALAALDAGLGMNALDGVEPQLSPVVRMSKDREEAIEIRISNERQKQMTLRLGLALPREFSSAQEELAVLLPAMTPLSKVAWPCTGMKRGRYEIRACHMEGYSPFGLWAVRVGAPVNAEVRVYPNLRTERRGLSALFLNRGILGLHAQRQIGKGRDFEQLRDYVPGDGYEDIHWKATAKRGRPVTKTYQIERTQEVYVVIDASRLSARDLPGGGAILERYVTAGLVLGLAAEQQGDLFGLITFSSRIESFVRAKSGADHYSRCRDAIYTLHPQDESPDFDELTTFIRLHLRRRALLIILTSLDDPVVAASFTRNIDLIARQHVVMVNMMQSPEVAPLFSGNEVEQSDGLYQRLSGHMLWNNLRELGKTLQRKGVQFSLTQNERLSAQLVTQYLTVKRRQLL